MIQEQANWIWIDERVKRLEGHIFNTKPEYELYGAVWHDEHGYQFTATVGEKVLNDDRWIKLYRKVEK